jgi:hypothetical protein
MSWDGRTLKEFRLSHFCHCEVPERSAGTVAIPPIPIPSTAPPFVSSRRGPSGPTRDLGGGHDSHLHHSLSLWERVG